jgi:hypothetical protein
MTDAFILGGVRTPVGRYGASLSHLRTDDLLGRTMIAACERVGVPLDHIEDITAGCVNTAQEGMGDVARWGALAAGFPDSVPAVTINRFCASSLTGAIAIAHAIRCDELGVGIAGGVESMSRSGWAQMKGDSNYLVRGFSSTGPIDAGLLSRSVRSPCVWSLSFPWSLVGPLERPRTFGAARGCAHAMHRRSELAGGGVGTRYRECLPASDGRFSNIPWYGN